MDIHHLRVSVGRTWRFSAAGVACVDDDPSAYRHRLDRLKSGERVSDYALPWPPYRSRFWRHMLTDSYQNTRTDVQVGTLLPLVWSTTVPAPPDAAGSWASADIEAVRHPFGITTLVHLDLSSTELWGEATAASELLRAVTTSTLTRSGRVEDGYPIESSPSLPPASFEGRAIDLEEVGRFTLLSALHGEPDGRAPASSLALRFDDEPQPERAAAVRSTNGAVCLSGETVGLALPDSLPRAAQRTRCLHHNYALLLAYMGNLAALVSATPAESARWYQQRAALLLHHLYLRTTPPGSASIYRSRLPELWIRKAGVAPAINALTPGVPGLPA